MVVPSTPCLLVAVCLLALASPCEAGLCDAKFMHEGGYVQFSGTGMLALGAELAFSEVSKVNGDNCQARVQGVAAYGYAGLPPGKSSLDHLLRVKNGHATFTPYGEGAEKPGHTGQFDLRILGLFTYDGKQMKQGQKMPAASYRFNIGKETAENRPPVLTVRIGEKVIGAKQTLQTVLGPQYCWPIVYPRDSEPIMVAFKGLTLPIPGMKTMVTDWFCPKVNVVVRQEIHHAGAQSLVEISQIK